MEILMVNLETQHPFSEYHDEFGPLFEQINHDLAAFIQSTYNPSAPLKERFLTWWGAFATFGNDRYLDLIYMEQLTTSHLYLKVGLQKSSAFYQEAKQIMKEGQELGLIQPQSISLLNQFVRGSITYMIKINTAAGRQLTAEEIKWLVSACWEGIAARNP